LRILIIEDNPDLAANVGDYLVSRGHSVDFARDGLSGLHLSVSNEYDVIVLDLMLPGLDGISLCRNMREQARSAVPVLMLTARDTLDEKIEGLEAGADDYMVKPFELRELAARLDVIARRQRNPGRLMEVADLSLDLDTFEVRRRSALLSLTPMELRLLEVLMRASPAVVSRAALEHALWGDAPPLSDALRLHVHGLRQAIDAGFQPTLVHTVRGRGWSIRDPGVDAA
jgi:DNA-binding response OmpR family regulator